MTRYGLTAALVLLFAAGAAAQIDVGDKAPEIKTDKLINGEAKSMRELKGKLILLEYFAHW